VPGLGAEEALHELLDAGDARDEIDREPVDAAKLPADERVDVGRDRAQEHALEVAHRRLLESERGARREWRARRLRRRRDLVAVAGRLRIGRKVAGATIPPLDREPSDAEKE